MATDLPLDVPSLRDLIKGEGLDTREWVSYGIVSTQDQSPEDRPIEFDPDYGPLVNVTLQPAGKDVRARVSGFIAGNGEGTWYPYLPGDEVVVICPNGKPENAIIIGRLNQQIDKFPTLVAGNDPSTNTFGFWRFVTPFIFESKNKFMIFNPVTTSAFIMEEGGNVTLRDGELSFLHLGADFLGLQTNDASLLLQMNLTTNTIRIAHNGQLGQKSAIFDINGDSSSFATGGSLTLSTAGNFAQFHGVTVESVIAIVTAMNAAIGAAILGLGGPAAYLAPIWANPGPISNLPGGAITDVGIAAAASLAFSDAYQQALNALMSSPKIPNIPGIGCIGLQLG